MTDNRACVGDTVKARTTGLRGVVTDTEPNRIKVQFAGSTSAKWFRRSRWEVWHAPSFAPAAVAGRIDAMISHVAHLCRGL